MLAIPHAFAGRGTESGGGGDPMLMESEVYPDPRGLDLAIEFSERAVRNSLHSQTIKDAFLTELAQLEAQNKFRMLPAIIVLGAGDGPGSYSSSLRQDKFVTLSGITLMSKGTNIYLAKRILGSPTHVLGSLIVHEVLHHILPIGLSEDEEFVDKITKTIITKSLDADVNRGLRAKGFFKPGKISRTSFLESSQLQKETISYFMKEQSSSIYHIKVPLHEWQQTELSLLKAFEKAIRPNISGMTFFEFHKEIYDEVKKVLPEKTSRPVIENYHGFLKTIITNWTKRVNPRFLFINEDSWGCNVVVHSPKFLPCDSQQWMPIEAIFKNY